MVVKKLIIEVEEGNTKCENCPFNGGCSIDIINRFGCTEYNLATMKIKEYEEN